jgi:hypothetical protein
LSLFNQTLTLDEDVLQCYSEYAAGGPLSILMQQLIQLSGDAPTSTTDTTSASTNTASTGDTTAVSSSAKRSSAEQRRASTPQKPSDFIRGEYCTSSVHMCPCRTKQHLV